jgi:hypothetical protein
MLTLCKTPLQPDCTDCGFLVSSGAEVQAESIELKEVRTAIPASGR